jgi:hypothetical protein
MTYLMKIFLLAAVVTTMNFASAQRCDISDDCVRNEEYCAGSVCTSIGSCSQRYDCFNPNNAPFAVPACEGFMDCTDQLCSMICGEQVCPDGGPRAECGRGNLPCDTETCEEAESCYNDPCGGSCTAVFFNAAGDIVCAEAQGSTEPPMDSTEPPMNGNIDASEPACNMDLDCESVFNETQAYCSQGKCLPMGSCTNDFDCVNPSNVYPVIACVGVLQCDTANGQCGRECGPSSCPEGVEEVNCVDDSCLDFDFGCAIAVSCVNNFCGECSAILFNDAGYVLEECNQNSTGITSETEFAADSCFSDMDCAEDASEYCADGICLTIGNCNERIDCFNPANSPYALPACVGLLDCNEGICTVICGPECPNGEERVPCPELSTCNVTDCDEAISCSLDGCGGECTQLFFDEAGTQVCVNTTAGLSCATDADCTGSAMGRADADGMYCAQGMCMSNGFCNEDLDCFNPSNIYATVDCVGFTSCQDGQCGVTCGPPCQDGSEGSVCDPSPCEVTECAAATACASDTCNGCNAVFFDAAGNQVENCDPPFATTTSTGGSASESASFQYSFVSTIVVAAMVFLSQLLI